jgi:hypothetical protein
MMCERKDPQPFVELISPGCPETRVRSLDAHEVRFGAVVCQANREVWRDDAGRIRTCTIARPAVVSGVPIAGDNYSQFHANGQLYQTHLSRPTRLTTAAGLAVPCRAEFVALSYVGALEYCTLDASLVVGAIPCRRGESIAFHPQGQLAAAVIDVDREVGSSRFPAGTRLEFTPEGGVAGGTLTEPRELLGYPVRSAFGVHPNGALAEFTLAEPRTIQGHDFPAFASIWLRADGSLERAVYTSARGVMVHGEPWSDEVDVTFDRAGHQLTKSVEHHQAREAPRPPHRAR